MSSPSLHAAFQEAVGLCARGAFVDADVISRRLLAAGTSAELLHLQGVIAMELGDLDLAVEVLARAVEIAPQSADLLACAALAASRAGRQHAAVELYERALHWDPHNLAALCGLGAVLQQSGDLMQAHRVFAACVSSHPGEARAWCNLGGIAVALGLSQQAEAAYRRAVQLAPSLVAGHQGLLYVLDSTGQGAQRNAAVQAWASACPDDPTASHLARSLHSGEPPRRCSAEFVAHYFDRFAATYDAVLEQLDTAVVRTFAAIWRDHQISAECVLDFGCGTGSASAWLAAPGRRIVGVDLSPAMLERARGSGHFDALHCADGIAFLEATNERFDAVVLADVLPYFGALTPLFDALIRCLHARAHVLLCFEQGSSPGYRLAPTGRFQHHIDEVRRAAESSGFAVAMLQTGDLRREGRLFVEGGYALLRRG